MKRKKDEERVAPVGLCPHRVPVTSFCKKCENEKPQHKEKKR